MSTGINTRGLRFLDATELTIASGAIAPTQVYHTVAAESGTTDDLDTINLTGYSDLTDGTNTFRAFLVLQAASGDTITIKDSTGNIVLSGGADVDISSDAIITLFYNGTNWTNVGVGSGGGGSTLPVDDTTSIVQDPVDTTKQMRIDVGGITTSTTRVATMPDADITLGTDDNAIHDNVAGEIAAIAEKVSPVSADLVVIEDSADSNNKKRVQLGNLPSSGGIGGSTGSTDNAVIRADGTGGNTVQASGVSIDDNDRLVIPDNATVGALNLTERSAEPTTPNSGDVYLDDGTNTENGVQSFRRYTGAAWEDLPGLYNYTDVIYVSQSGDDANDGTSPQAPKLTIGSAITAANALTPSSTNRVQINVLDAGTYTEDITMVAHVGLYAPGVTFVGEIEIPNDCWVVLNRHFAGTLTNLVQRVAGAGYSHYRANVVDGRGTSGSLTGKRNIVSGGNGAVLFVKVDLMFVSASGEGVRDVAGGFGHVHIHIYDLYLAGNSARGLYGFNGNSNFIGYIDHILEVDSPTGTVGISNTGSPAIMELVIGEIVCDTAIDVNNGAVSALVSKIDATTAVDVDAGASLYLTCPNVTGAISNAGTLKGRIGDTIYTDVTLDGQPAVGDFTNATHDHEDAAGGGTLASAATPSAIHDDVASEISAITAKATPTTSDYLLIEDAADSNNKKSITIGDLPGGSGGLYASVAILKDEKSTTTDGGSASATTWNARDLNTEASDTDNIVSIASNQFTPVAGDYEIHVLAPAFRVDGHRIRLYNVTGASVVQEGQNAEANSSSGASGSPAILTCTFTANGTDAYRIDHYTQTARANDGLGRPVSDGSSEVYLVVVLYKLS